MANVTSNCLLTCLLTCLAFDMPFERYLVCTAVMQRRREGVSRVIRILIAFFAEIFDFAEIFSSEAARMATKWPAHTCWSKTCDAVVMLMDVATSLVLPRCYGCALARDLGPVKL